jgi:hypothetical protein
MTEGNTQPEGDKTPPEGYRKTTGKYVGRASVHNRPGDLFPPLPDLPIPPTPPSEPMKLPPFPREELSKEDQTEE